MLHRIADLNCRLDASKGLDVFGTHEPFSRNLQSRGSSGTEGQLAMLVSRLKEDEVNSSSFSKEHLGQGWATLLALRATLETS